MSAVKSLETDLDESLASALGLDGEGLDSQELDSVTGDYATRLEEVLGNEDDAEDENEDEGFLYQGADSLETSATYNEQLHAFLDGLDDEVVPTHGDHQVERQVENELNEAEKFVYEVLHTVRK